MQHDVELGASFCHDRTGKIMHELMHVIGKKRLLLFSAHKIFIVLIVKYLLFNTFDYFRGIQDFPMSIKGGTEISTFG